MTIAHEIEKKKDRFTQPTPPPKAPNWMQPALDVVLVIVAFVLAYFVRYELQFIRPVLELNQAPFEPYLPYAITYAALLYMNYRGSGLYRSIRGRSWTEEVYTIINGVTNATVVVMALSFVFQPLVFSRLLLVYVAAFTIVLLSTARIIRRVVQARERARGVGVQRVLIVGAGEVGQAVMRTMVARKELGYQLVGVLDDNPLHGEANIGRIQGLGVVDNLPQMIAEQDVNMVVITLPWSYHDRILELVAICQKHGVEARVVPDVFQLNLRQVQVENLDGIPLLSVNDGTFEASNRLLKRTLDITLIVLASPVLLLVFTLTALAIRLEGKGSVFYRARRVGENGREFDMLKFRSMQVDADKIHHELVQAHGEDPRHPKIKNDPRITRVGRVIRTLSIDELPQLINVLRGEMSLVGPRPPTPEEVGLYDDWHMQRLSIMPGITGLWQVSGRSNVPFEEMCLIDIYYIENWSLKLDFSILLRTIPHVVSGEGAY